MSEPAARDALPRILGRYAIYDAVASGAMATVHLGRLLGPVGFSRTVAIKRLHPQYAQDPEFVTMFLDEAQMAARIRHPNVVSTLDVVAEQNEIFLVMDYVHGDSLGQIQRSLGKRGETIPIPIVLRIATDALQGLHAAHQATDDHGILLNLVHRDISPQNILLGVDGVSRLVDFGVAKAAGRAQATRDGHIKGKLSYMAPEQLRAQPVTRQADVHAFAIVLWEMLSGKRLFVGTNETQLITAVTRHDVPSLVGLVPGLPPALDLVVTQGAAINVAERFATAREMCVAIGECGPIATTLEVADWVQGLTRETVDRRSKIMSTIERDRGSERSEPRLDVAAAPGSVRASVAPPQPAAKAPMSTSKPPVVPSSIGTKPPSPVAKGVPPSTSKPPAIPPSPVAKPPASVARPEPPRLAAVPAVPPSGPKLEPPASVAAPPQPPAVPVVPRAVPSVVPPAVPPAALVPPAAPAAPPEVPPAHAPGPVLEAPAVALAAGSLAAESVEPGVAKPEPPAVADAAAAPSAVEAAPVDPAVEPASPSPPAPAAPAVVDELDVGPRLETLPPPKLMSAFPEEYVVPTRAPPKALLWAAGVACVALFIGTALAIKSRSSSTSEPVAVAPSSLATPATSAAPTSEPPPQAPAATPSDGAAAMEFPANPTPSATAPAARAPVVAPLFRPNAGARKPPKPSCNPPFTMDKQGVRVPKRECFK